MLTRIRRACDAREKRLVWHQHMLRADLFVPRGEGRRPHRPPLTGIGLGIPAYLTPTPWQSILNDSARMLFEVRRYVAQ